MSAVLMRERIREITQSEAAESLWMQHVTFEGWGTRCVWTTEHATLCLFGDLDGLEGVSVWSVEVDADHRGKGYGRLLMETITVWADLVGEPLSLYVRCNNEPAVKLYRRVGFTVAEKTVYCGTKVYRMTRQPQAVAS